MSNNQPPPSHWGQAGYEQWPPYPGMMPSNPYLPTAPLPSTPPFPNPSHTFPYNMRAPDANAPAPPPSASAGPALFYQPAFPYTGHLDASNISTPGLPHLPIPPYGYPPVPAPSGSSQPLSGPWEIRSTDANQAPASRSQTQGPGDIIMNREEGELSEHGDRPTDTPNKASAQQSYSAPHCGLEEGETVSSATSSGSSSRTSPYTSFTRDRKANSSLKPAAYNPPLSVSADADVVHRAIENQKRDVPLASSEKSEEASTKSTAQMKIQAKGALLSLAAHGIRYDELVAEGCNAAILRTLYAEIGIRVPTSQADNASIEKRGKSTALRTEKPATTTLATAKSSGMPIIATTSSAPIAPTASSSHVTKSSEIKDSTSHERANPELPVKDASKLSEPVPAASVPSSKKPMERKEVIAKMLAAKAAQASEPNAPSKETSISAATKDSPAETTKLPVREINKAKTELARQRIEELKKKMLLKQREQQQIEAQQLGQASTTAQPNQPAVPGVTSAPAVQHPLPVRPPSPSAEPAKIPGLSLLGSNPDQTAPAVHPLALNSVTVNSTPVSRSAQRKRLQASDFDEPVGSPKKPFNSSEAPPLTETKLIIDISEDDESLYGDDQGDGMDIDSGPAVAPISTRSTLSRNSSAVRASTSTPQEHDQESIREKQLEIEALHRKIAEAEERQKARLAASGTQSPRTGNDSSVSSSAQSHIPDAREDDLAVDGNVRQEINDQNRTTTDVHVGDTVMNETEYEMYGRSLFANLPDSEKAKGISPFAESHGPYDSNVPSRSAAQKRGVQHAGEGTTSTSSAASSVGASSTSSGPSSAASAVTRSAADNTEEMAVAITDVPAPPVADSTASTSAADMNKATESNIVKSPRKSSPSRSDSTGSSMDVSSDGYAGSSGQNSPYHSPTVVHSTHETEQSHHELSEDSDDYEPPEPDTSAGSPSYSPHYTPSDNPSMKPGPLTALDENLGESVSQSVGEPQPETSMQGPSDPTGVPQHPTEFLGASRDQASSTETDRQFTPYDSSLKMFRAYRFHPDYLQNVSDGYRSLTYSHNIDSTRTFCPYESSGGVCNDNTCGFQHFRDITLSDDKILVQMGALREGQTEEEKEAYVAGLKEIINGMRRDKVKEFSTVANEIAAYRRRVLQDPSRVLHL